MDLKEYKTYELSRELGKRKEIKSIFIEPYTDLRELTPEVLRTFIERIIIHERTAKHSKSAMQQIDICFRYIGKLAPEAIA